MAKLKEWCREEATEIDARRTRGLCACRAPQCYWQIKRFMADKRVWRAGLQRRRTSSWRFCVLSRR